MGVINLDKDKIYISIIVFLLVILVGGFTYLRENGNSPQLNIESPKASDELERVEEKSIYIHVSGHVMRPGVYQLPEGSRVFEAIQAAGGATVEGDIQKLNLAQIVHDGQKIIVPGEGEEEKTQEGDVVNNNGKVNINTAPSELLQTLPGIGPARAQGIIEYRQQHGPFKRIEDIQNVSGIGTSIFNQIKDKIVVN
jgi:competence protein ComEA